MLWPFILPLQITLCVALVVLLCTSLLAKTRGKKPGRALAWCLLAVIILFVPSCTAIMWSLDTFRFGVFQYADYAAVQDFRVERYLPPSAREIVVNKYPQGFVARFKIERDQLDQWFDQFWAEYGPRSATRRGEVVSSVDSPPDEFDNQLRIEAIDYLGGWTEYVGPMAPNGAGFELWYNDEAAIAYQTGGYW